MDVDVLVLAGSIMLAIHLFTAFCACHLPETKGREIGHTSLDDDDIIADDDKDALDIISSSLAVKNLQKRLNKLRR